MRWTGSTRNRDCGGSERRGQTTLDFTVGSTLFLLVLTVVFLFVPGSLQPFTEGGQEKIVSVNRVADSLTEGALGSPETPNVLNTTCTVDFFERNSPSSYCGYSESDLDEQLGLVEERSVNVSLRGNVTAGGETDGLLCWDGSANEVKERSDCDSGDELLTAGEIEDGGSTSSVTARRVVSFVDEDVFLVVELW